MANKHKIIAVIPAYNEASAVAQVVEDVKAVVDEVLVVDDGSSDRTYEAAVKSGAFVIRHILNRGQGAALETGNRLALLRGADIVVHFDADGQFLAGEIADIVSPLVLGEADIVFGSRFKGKVSEIPRFKRLILFPLGQLFNRMFIGQTLSDPQNGFRALNRAALRKIRIQNDGSAHCSEIIYKAFHSGLKIKEVPISVVYNEFGQNLTGGKGRGMGGIRVVKDLVIYRLLN